MVKYWIEIGIDTTDESKNKYLFYLTNKYGTVLMKSNERYDSMRGVNMAAKVIAQNLQVDYLHGFSKDNNG